MYPDFYLLNLILPQPLLLLRAAQEKEGRLSSPSPGLYAGEAGALWARG